MFVALAAWPSWVSPRLGGRRARWGSVPLADPAALDGRVVSPAFRAGMEIPACRQPTSTLIVTPAYLEGPAGVAGPSRRWARRRPRPRRPARRPSPPRTVRVLGAVLGEVVVQETDSTARDGPRPPSEGFTIEPGVWDRPVQTPPGEGLPSELTVVGHPPPRLVVPFSPDNCRQIGEEFRSLQGEPSGQESSHGRKLLRPLWD